MPNKEMLAAPSTKAVHTLSGGPGRSPAATTSQRMNSAGATAAVPITVGRDWSRFMELANKPFCRSAHNLLWSAVRPAGRCCNQTTRIGTSAAVANSVHPFYHRVIIINRTRITRCAVRPCQGDEMRWFWQGGGVGGDRRVDLVVTGQP